MTTKEETCVILPRDLLRRCGAALADQTAFIDGDWRRTWGDMDRRADRFAAIGKIAKAALRDGLRADPSQLPWSAT